MNGANLQGANQQLTADKLQRTYGEIEAWLIDSFAQLSLTDALDIDVERAFVDYQLDSSVAVTLAQRLGEWGGNELQATIFWEHPNIAELARALSLDA